MDNERELNRTSLVYEAPSLQIMYSLYPYQLTTNLNIRKAATKLVFKKL